MRLSSRVSLSSLSALGAVLLLSACNERAPEKAEGVAAPSAQPPATTASPDTMSPANPPPGDAAPAPSPPTLPPDPDATPTPLPNDPTDPTQPLPPPHGG